jgi:DNA polymerase III subunit epsilon
MSPDEMIASLEAQGDFRVLRRLRPVEPMLAAPAGARRALLLDVETTGLDPNTDDIIELAMVPFFYSASGEVVGIGDAFSALRQPTKSIPTDVTKITGIDDLMVKGKSIDPVKVAAFAGSNLIVAHNAAFDRKFMEKFCPALAQNPWACSMNEVPWSGEGFESNKLAYLALSSGFYYDRHRAMNDCHAAIELLSRRLPVSGDGAFAGLLASARKITRRCWAENTPFESKDLLKQRGYRWNGEDNGQPRAWWTDVCAGHIAAEKVFLCAEIYKRDTIIRTASITAFNRYTNRVAFDD